MRHFILVCTLFLVLFQSCGNNEQKLIREQQEKKDKEIRDSITLVEKVQFEKEKATKDSIISIEEQKVIGDIMFGMTEKEVKSEIKDFNKENQKLDDYLFKASGKRFYDYFIGNYEYSTVRGFYYDGKLYKVMITGKPILWDYFDSEVPKNVKAISDVIKAKYGNPSTQSNILPRYQMQEHYTYLVNSWTIGVKEIQVRISDKGTSYWVNTIISMHKIEKRIEHDKIEKEKQSTQKSKDVF